MKEIMFQGVADIQIGDQKLIVSRLEETDIRDVAAMYRSIQITKLNYREKLSKDHKKSFEKTGGMFVICDENKLRKIISDNTQIFLTVKNMQGVIGGIIWFGLDDDLYVEESNMILHLKQEDFYQKMEEFRRLGIVAYGKEIIFDREKGMKKQAEILFYVMFQILIKEGFSYGTGEAYRVVEYVDEGGRKEVDLINHSSMRCLIRTGGVPVGRLKKKELRIDDIQVGYFTELVYWNLEDSVKRLEETLKECSICIKIRAKEHTDGSKEIVRVLKHTDGSQK